jgi:hypothetical protein
MYTNMDMENHKKRSKLMLNEYFGPLPCPEQALWPIWRFF